MKTPSPGKEDPGKQSNIIVRIVQATGVTRKTVIFFTRAIIRQKDKNNNGDCIRPGQDTLPNTYMGP
jgi:hypothetical protein